MEPSPALEGGGSAAQPATTVAKTSPANGAVKGTGYPEAVAQITQKFQAITAGHSRVQERFFAGSRSASRSRQGSESPGAVVATTAPGHSQVAATAPHSKVRSPPVRTTQFDFEVVGGRRVPVRMSKPIAAHAAARKERSAETQPRARFPRGLDMGTGPARHLDRAPNYREPFYTGPRGAPVGGYATASIPRVPDAVRNVSFGRTTTAPPVHPEAPPLHRVLEPETEPTVVYQRERPADSWFLGKVATYPQPMAQDDEDGPVSSPSPQQSLSSRSPPPALPPDDTLAFDSKFESGNLSRATRTGMSAYELLLDTDLYTEKHTQWYYFSVQNMRKGRTYTFRIVNLLKPDSLYNHGMQPCVYSAVREKRDRVGWLRGGSHIRYYKNNTRVPFARGERYYYTLTWRYTCEEENDTVHFAHCYPYTYTDLQNYLTSIAEDPQKSKVCRQHEMRLRRGVVVTARVHPGESNASWMMKGFLDFITSDHPDARTLRHCFIFKVVPMLNPDGVIVGNYRTSLAGVDLNRVYKRPKLELFPTITALKSMMRRLRDDRPVILYVDLHGHSRKQNIFVYGCNNEDQPSLAKRECVFPKMLALNGPSHFYYRGCRFAVKANKESTGRVNTWRELGLLNAFTLEATFCGSTIGELRQTQFNTRDFEKMGEILCDTILDYCDPNPAKKAKLLLEMRGSAVSGDEDEPGSSSDESVGSDSSESDGATERAEVLLTAVTAAGGDPAAVAAAAASITAVNPSTDTFTKPKVVTRKSRKQRDDAARDKTDKDKIADDGVGEDVQGRDSHTSLENAGGRRFVSRYEGQSGGGLPQFAQQQADERRRRKAEMRDARLAGRISGRDDEEGLPVSSGSPRRPRGAQSSRSEASTHSLIARYLAYDPIDDTTESSGRDIDSDLDDGIDVVPAGSRPVAARRDYRPSTGRRSVGRRQQGRPSTAQERPPAPPRVEREVLPMRSFDMFGSTEPGLDPRSHWPERRIAQVSGRDTTALTERIASSVCDAEAALGRHRPRQREDLDRSYGSRASPEEWESVKHRLTTFSEDMRPRATGSRRCASQQVIQTLTIGADSSGIRQSRNSIAAKDSGIQLGAVPLHDHRSHGPDMSIPAGPLSASERLEEHARRRKRLQILASGATDHSELAELATLRETAAASSRPRAQSSTLGGASTTVPYARPWSSQAEEWALSAGAQQRTSAAGSSLHAVQELRTRGGRSDHEGWGTDDGTLFYRK